MGVGCGLPAWIDEAEQHEGGSQARRISPAGNETSIQRGKQG